MKKVFLYAYDRQNLGDDLFVHSITQRYPDVKFYIWTGAANRKTYASLKNLKVIDTGSFFVKTLGRLRTSLISRYKQYFENNCDAVVFIGGSIFIEYDNWRQILNWWEYEAQKSPFLALGANFGPYRSADFLEGHKVLFRQMKDVCFRDLYSYNLFQDVKQVRCAPDILFSQAMPKRKCLDKQVLISVIDCCKKNEGSNQFAEMQENYIRSLKNAIIGFLREGYKVRLTSFCYEEGDEEMVELLIKKVKEAIMAQEAKRLSTLYYDGTNSEEMLQAISDSDCVIASRFHAVVLSIVAGIPVHPIIYSDKTKHVLEDIGFMNEYSDLRSMKDTDFECIKKNFQNYQMDMQNISNLKKEAENHYRVLDRILC